MSQILKDCLYRHVMLTSNIGDINELINIIKQYNSKLKDYLSNLQSGGAAAQMDFVKLNTAKFRDNIYPIYENVSHCCYHLANYYDIVVEEDDGITYICPSFADSDDGSRYNFGNYKITIYPHAETLLNCDDLPIKITTPCPAVDYPRGYIYPGVKRDFIQSINSPRDVMIMLNNYQYYSVFSIFRNLFNGRLSVKHHSTKWNKWKIT